MDAMRALTQGQGCTADGTASAANPMSGFVNQAMGGPGGKGGQVMGGPRGFAPRGAMGAGQRSAIERGMAQGMGMQGDPRAARQMRGPRPQQQMGAGNSFVQEFEQFRGAGARGPMGRGPMARGPVDGWVNDFAQMNVGPRPHFQQNAAMQAAFRDSFRPPPPMSAMQQAWQARGPAPQRAMNAAWQARGPMPQRAMNAAWGQAKAAPAPAAQAPMDAAWKQAAPAQAPMDSAWKEAAPAPQAAAAPMDAAWKEAAPANPLEAAMSKAWQDSLDGKEVDFENVWKNAMQQEGGSEALEAAFRDASGGGALDSAWADTQTASGTDAYQMQGDNPYLEHPNPYEEGLQLFADGQLNDAALAFEAAVQKDEGHVDAWRMLGVTHQEHDEDRKAITCLETAVSIDAYHLDALLGLGVSYVNELDQERALKNLKGWVMNNPNFQGLEVTQDPYGDGSLMDEVMQLMLKAAEFRPDDADVQEVLGVLYNVSRDYDSAVRAFQIALNHRPDEYSLWNKMGATLANGSRSEEALPAYHRALELKPKYARGWLNLGISHSNLSNYSEAARCYLKALDLNPGATHIWSYLRICFTVMERYDLIKLADQQNIDGLRAEFEF